MPTKCPEHEWTYQALSNERNTHYRKQSSQTSDDGKQGVCEARATDETEGEDGKDRRFNPAIMRETGQWG